MIKGFVDRRISQRFPFNAEVTLRLEQNFLYQTSLKVDLQLENGRHCNSTLKDISFAGLRLRLAEEIPVNQLAILYFDYEEICFGLTGRCVWLIPISKDSQDYIAGISFSNLSPEEFGKIRSLIFKLSHQA